MIEFVTLFEKILSILWMLLKIGVLGLIVFFVWALIIGVLKKLKEEHEHD